MGVPGGVVPGGTGETPVPPGTTPPGTPAVPAGRLPPLSAGDERVRLDLDQHVGVDQPPDFDDAGRRPDRAEDLPVRAADRFPVGDICDVYAGTHDIAQLGASAPQ